MERPGWQEASAFAARAHGGQLRRDGVTPYVSHAFRVALTVRDLFGVDDAVAVTAAVLHDTIEDTPTDYDDILEGFGVEVASVVAALSKNMLLPEAERERDYDDRLARADWRARLVKLADVYDNLCDLETRDDGEAAGARLRARARRALDLVASEREARKEIARGAELVERALAGA